MERVIAILLLFLVCNTGYCQLKPLTKKELKTLIKEGIAKDKNYCWEICTDTTIVKSDTIVLRIGTSAFSACELSTGWRFKSNNSISEISTKITVDSNSSGLRYYRFYSGPETPANYYKIKIRLKQNKLILQRYNMNKLLDTYRIVGYKAYTESDEEFPGPTLTLIKQ